MAATTTMESRVCRSTDEDEDDDDFHHFMKVKKELVEEKNIPLIKNESSQIKTNSKLQRCKRKRITSHSVGEINLKREVGSHAMVQARRVQLSLGTEFPSFIKLLCKSHVEGYKIPQVRLPFSFCRLYLPKDEHISITLEDEDGENFELKFLSQWMKFSVGWKYFVDHHRLRERDVLIFHLVEPTKFKVYIVRADDHINPKSSLVEQNGQGVLESFDLSYLSQELGTFEDFNSKHVRLLSAGKTKLERKQCSPAVLEANCIQMSKYPSFTKTIMKYIKELRISPSFCTLHLPKVETMMILEDENEDQFKVKYMPKWKGLSAGWIKFFNAHNLHEGDVLLFHLVNPKKFKVYITRLEDLQFNVNPSLKQQIKQGGSESSDDPVDQSIDLGKFAEFQIKVRSLCLEFELDDNTLKKYYKLCCSKNDILHDKILNLNSKLIASIIIETVEISAAVKASDIFTPREKLEQWEVSLKSFKLLGMNVEFLVDRVSQLLKIRVEYEETRFEDEIIRLESKRAELKKADEQAYERIGVAIKILKSDVEMQKVKFQQVIDSPW